MATPLRLAVFTVSCIGNLKAANGFVQVQRYFCLMFVAYFQAIAHVKIAAEIFQGDVTPLLKCFRDILFPRMIAILGSIYYGHKILETLLMNLFQKKVPHGRWLHVVEDRCTNRH